MAKLAFCGLGQMGLPMALRLVDAGHDLWVWNRTPGKAGPVVERGARQARSPAEAGAGAEAAITMLASPEALEEVVLGADGLAHGLAPGSTLIEMSTVGPQAIRALADRLPGGIGVPDAPVLGTVPQATEGSLKIFVGGTQGMVERWRPVLSSLGAVRRVGPLGAGASMKLVVNSTLLALMTALAEALALADALGLDQSEVLDVLADSPISVPARSKRPRIESGDYPPNFKDASLVVQTAQAAGLDLPVAEAGRRWMAGAEQAGMGDLDYSAVVAHARGRPARLPDGERSGESPAGRA